MVDITDSSKNLFKPFTEIRTGVKINTFEEDVAECYRLTHDHLEDLAFVRTEFGVWFHGICPCCKAPIDSWAHPNNCGTCGVNLRWPTTSKEESKEDSR